MIPWRRRFGCGKTSRNQCFCLRPAVTECVLTRRLVLPSVFFWFVFGTGQKRLAGRRKADLFFFFFPGGACMKLAGIFSLPNKNDAFRLTLLVVFNICVMMSHGRLCSMMEGDTQAERQLCIPARDPFSRPVFFCFFSKWLHIAVRSFLFRPGLSRAALNKNNMKKPQPQNITADFQKCLLRHTAAEKWSNRKK